MMELIHFNTNAVTDHYRQDGRPTADTVWLKVAFQISDQGTCPRAYVGCVIVDEHGHVVSTGYNGAPSKQPHCREVGCNMDGDHCVRVVHAETNALISADPRRLRGATAYTTLEPCQRCAVQLQQMGIGRVFYAESLASWRARNHRA